MKKVSLLAAMLAVTVGSSVALYAVEKYHYNNSTGFAIQRAEQTAAIVGGVSVLVLIATKVI